MRTSSKLLLILAIAGSLSILQGQQPVTKEAAPELGEVKIPPPTKLSPESHYGDITKRIYDNLPISHYLEKPLDDSISKLALENYIKMLDSNRSLFLWDDVKQFRKKRLKLDDSLKAGDTEFAFEVFRMYRENLGKQITFIQAALEKGFDDEVKETYVFDREKEPWPKTEAEREELWRKRIKNEYVAAKVSRALDAEEAEKRKAEGKDAEKDDDEEKPPSIEEMIGKRYQAILTNVNQHDSEHVLDLFLNAVTTAYDSHSSYLSPRRFEDFNINIGLSLTGIGAQLTVEDGAAKISSVIKGGPAAADGRLKKGDKIIGVGQGKEEIVDIMYWPLYKSVRLIRGKKGTTVVLKVIPADDPGKVVKYDIVRDEVKLEENAAKAKVHQIRETTKKREYKLGYIDLPDFYEDMRRRVPGGPPPRSCSLDVKRFLVAMEEKEKVDGLILDLRDNGGGSLRACVELSGLFIESGPVVQVKDETPKTLSDPDIRQVFTKPLIVLVNRHSASASEILAAALQDYGRAIIIGDSKTHGKGSVQSLFPLDRRDPELGSFKVTTSAFFRINGQSTQLKGVTPDILLPSPLDSMDVGEEFLDNVLEWQTIDPVPHAAIGRLHNLITKLSEQSKERRDEDEDYKAYEDMLEKHAAIMEREEVTLHYADRLAMTRADRALGKLRVKYGRQDIWEDDKVEDEDEDKDEDEEDGKDLVLDESFRIMCDFIRALEEEKLLIEGGA